MTPEEHAKFINDSLRSFSQNNNLFPINISGPRYKRLVQFMEWAYNSKRPLQISPKTDSIVLTWDSYHSEAGCWGNSQYCLRIKAENLSTHVMNDMACASISEAKKLKINVYCSYHNIYFNIYLR